MSGAIPWNAPGNEALTGEEDEMNRGDVGDRFIKTDRETWGNGGRGGAAIPIGSDYLQRTRPLAPFFQDPSLLPKAPPRRRDP